MTVQLKSIILELARLPPRSVSTRLLSSEATLTEAGLLGSTFGSEEFLLFSAIAKRLQTAEDGVQVAVDEAAPQEQIWWLTRGAQAVRLKRSGATVTILSHELNLLDPEQGRRRAGFEKIKAEALPFLPTQAEWQAKIETAPLTPFEFRTLLVELTNVAEARLTALGEKLDEKKEIGVGDIVPTGRLYFESLAGRIRTDLRSEEYVEQVLVPSLRDGFAQNRQWGWLRAEAAYVGASLDLGKIFEQVADDELFAAVQAGDSDGAPLAPVAAIAASLPRVAGNAAFLHLAKAAMAQIVARAKLPAGSLAPFALHSAFCVITYRRLSIDLETAGAPAYWRRLTAAMHTHLLMGLLDLSSPNLQRLAQWAHQAHDQLGEIAEYIDFQAEPMYSSVMEQMRAPTQYALGVAMRLCVSATHGELVLSTTEQEALKGQFPAFDAIRTCGYLPDSLSGSPRVVDMETPAQMEEHIGVELATDLAARRHERAAWQRVLIYTRLLVSTPTLTERMQELVKDAFTSEATSTENSLEVLGLAARTAAAQAEVALSNAIAETLLENADRFSTRPLVDGAWSVLALAAAANRNKSDWTVWLEEKLTVLAYRLPLGEACKQLADTIDLTHKLSPLPERAFSRPRYVAACGGY
jgi:hypothetical protein